MQHLVTNCLIISLLIAGGVWHGTAQIKKRDSLPDKSRYNFRMIKSNPLALLWSQIPFTGEAKLLYEEWQSAHTSSMVGFSYIFKSPLFPAFKDQIQVQYDYTLRVNGFRLQGAQKIFLLKKFLFFNGREPEGIYLAPHFSINSAKFTFQIRQQTSNNRVFQRTTSINYNFLNLSVIGGAQLIGGRFCIDVYGGIGVRHNFLMVQRTPTTLTTQRTLNMGIPNLIPNQLKISFSTNIGYTF